MNGKTLLTNVLIYAAGLAVGAIVAKQLRKSGVNIA